MSDRWVAKEVGKVIEIGSKGLREGGWVIEGGGGRVNEQLSERAKGVSEGGVGR